MAIHLYFAPWVPCLVLCEWLEWVMPGILSKNGIKMTSSWPFPQCRMEGHCWHWPLSLDTLEASRYVGCCYIAVLLKSQLWLWVVTLVLWCRCGWVGSGWGVKGRYLAGVIFAIWDGWLKVLKHMLFLSMRYDRMSGMMDASICLVWYSFPGPSWVEVGNGIIALLSWRCDGQILGQAVVLTNLFLAWNSCGCNISFATLWRRRLSCNALHRSGKSWCSLSWCFLSWSSFRSALRTVWQLLVLLMQGFQLQCLGAFYCVGFCGQGIHQD